MTWADITFTVHPAGRVRTCRRNTMRGWVDERLPEGILTITLEDGFSMFLMGDECMVTDRDFLFDLAREARDFYARRAA